MLPATNRGVGMNIGFPDVCLTPAGPAVVPVPYPNFAMAAQAAAFSPVVKVSGVNALNLGSMIPMTSGDEAGVAHPTIKGPGKYVMGNPIVYVDRLPAINLTCPTMGNTGNNALGAVLVPSAVNVFYTYAHHAPAAVDAGTAAKLGDEMLGRTARATISWAMLDERIGAVKIGVITTDMARQFHVACKALQDLGAETLVLDLRDCPGGDLDGAVEWAARFLPEGVEIVRMEDADGDESIRYASLPATYTMPIVVWVNENTASAAELFVAALQANGRAKVIGRQTYGKSTVQHFIAGQTDSFAYPTVARWRVRNAKANDCGILPDTFIAANESDEDWLTTTRTTLLFCENPNPA